MTAVAKFRIKDKTSSCKFLKKMYFLFKYTCLSTDSESAVPIHLSERIRCLTVRVTEIVSLNIFWLWEFVEMLQFYSDRTVLKVTLH